MHWNVTKGDTSLKLLGVLVWLPLAGCRSGDAAYAPGLGAGGNTAARQSEAGAATRSHVGGDCGLPMSDVLGNTGAGCTAVGGGTSATTATSGSGGSSTTPATVATNSAAGSGAAANTNRGGASATSASGASSGSASSAGGASSGGASSASGATVSTLGGRGGVGNASATTSIVAGNAGTAGSSPCDPGRESCPCAAGQVRCDGVCINPLADAVHCGATLGCDNQTGTPGVDCRPANSICSAGLCKPCNSGEVACENRCLDPNTDETYCGAAPGCSPSTNTRGDRCWGSERCLAATCVDCLTFSTKASARLGDHVQQIAIADVTGDKHLDIVTVLQSDAQIVLFPGDGTGNVGTAQRQSFGTGPVGLALGKLNDDSLFDAVIGDYTAGVVRIAVGQSDGKFTEIQSLPVAGKPTRIVLAQVDQGATLDAFVVESGANQIELFLGNGDGTFRAAPPIALPNAVAALATGDINGDGRLDVVAAGNAEPMFILLGDGTGSFTRTQHPIEGYTRDILLVDLNGDKQLDVVSAHSMTYNTNISIGKGDGTFQTAQRLMVGKSGLSGASVAVTDFNADGLLDVVVGMGSGIYVVWGHDNWGTYTQYQKTLDESTDASWLTIADIDENGTPDIISRGNNWTVREYLGAVPAACR